MGLNRLRLRTKLMLCFILVFIPFSISGGVYTFHQIRGILSTVSEAELKNSTQSLSRLIRTAASVSIRNRLRAIAEKNLDIAEFYYNKHRSGLMTRQEALATIQETFLSQSIGISGYIYVLDSHGDVVIHPFEDVEGTNVSEFDFARRQILLKDGYIEYEWRNPGETEKRPKALYMTYFKPLDWIISVSSYREEFNHLVEVDDFKDSVLAYRFGKSGYAFVFDLKGTLLVHPWLQGKNMLDYNESSAGVVSYIMAEKQGRMTYDWQNPGDPHPREKIVSFDYLPEYGWFVVSSSYVKEVQAPLTDVVTLLFTISMILLAVATLFTVWISASITRPLEVFVKQLEFVPEGKFSMRINLSGSREIQRLSRYFNRFMDQMESYHAKIGEEIGQHVKTQVKLRKSELKLKAFFDQSFQFSAILSPKGSVEAVNQTALTFAGCSEKEVLGSFFWDTPWWRHDPEAALKIKESVRQAAQGRPVRFETTNVSSDNRIRYIDYSIKPLLGPDGHILFLIPEGRDITDLKQFEADRIQLETQLQQAQKMESIGTLAGGIAHNFNNILMGIQGRASLMKLDRDLSDGNARHLDGIEASVGNAVKLTRQLLAFSRGGNYQLEPTDINTLVRHENQLFAETRKEIRVRESLAPDLWKARVDKGQLEQVLLNLYVNAWQAMPRGGDLRITTSNVTVEKSDNVPVLPAQGLRLPAGRFVRITVSDTGTGMDSETLEQIFDPFFTTKDPGSGNGLGLASVFGIIKDHEGFIHVTSRSHKGSSFILYLPAIDHETEPEPSKETDRVRTVRGTLLLVDDETTVLKVTRQMLTKLGYTVLTADSGASAVDIYTREGGNIDLVILDIIMPGMDGGAVFDHLTSMDPEVKILLASGYSEDGEARTLLEKGCCGFIQKPFTLEALSTKIRGAMGSDSNDHSV